MALVVKLAELLSHPLPPLGVMLANEAGERRVAEAEELGAHGGESLHSVARTPPTARSVVTRNLAVEPESTWVTFAQTEPKTGEPPGGVRGAVEAPK